METTYVKKLFFLLPLFILLFSPFVLNAQVGINTTDPDGILDVNSSTSGIVLPRIALNSTDVAGPVLNPQGGELATGTVVYNTNTTSTGTNDVFPGVYVWNGNEWFNKFPKKHSQIFKQTSMVQPTNSGYRTITGLTGQTFTARYTGTYKIEVSVNYGTGYVKNLNASETDIAVQEGTFRFRFNGVDRFINAKANASNSTSGTRYYAIWQQHSYVEYIDLVAGTNYSFSLHFDQFTNTAFENDGNSGTGRGYIGIPDHAPCSVEFTYIRD